MHKVIEKQALHRDFPSAVEERISSHEGLDVVLCSRATLNLIIVQFKHVLSCISSVSLESGKATSIFLSSSIFSGSANRMTGDATDRSSTKTAAPLS